VCVNIVFGEKRRERRTGSGREEINRQQKGRESGRNNFEEHSAFAEYLSCDR
jgi:hypothetical protein